jgi:hypothetical protein
MNKFIPMILAIVMVSCTGNVFAEEEYDLSDHPVYNWEWNENINFSSETISHPKSSNDHVLEYNLSILKVDFDPTHIYYVTPTITYDYCEMEQFAKYPRCR